MRIESLRLKGVGPFDDTTIEFPAGNDPDRADVYLLVGENGSGKTTILKALASSHDEMVHDDVRLRLVNPDAYIEVAFVDARMALSASKTSAPPKTRHFGRWGSGLELHGDDAGCELLKDVGPAHRIKDLSRRKPLSHVVIAYGTQRMVTAAHVRGVEALRTNPLRRTAGSTHELPQWLMNTRFRASTARDEGDGPGARQYEAKLAEVEQALSEIIGEPAHIRTDTETLTPLLEFDGKRVPIDLLPDGLRALLSWVGDLYMRLERIPWVDDLPIRERAFTLLVDEVDIHLHPRWQRRVLHVCQTLFPKAQIIASTHSPHVINSVSDAFILVLERKDGTVIARPPMPAQTGRAAPNVLADILGVPQAFNLEVEADLTLQSELITRCLQGEDARAELDTLSSRLQSLGGEAAEMAAFRLYQMERAGQAAK